MDGPPQFQFSLKALFTATAGVCAALAILHWAGVFVAGLASYLSITALLLAQGAPDRRYGTACFGLAVIILLATLVDLVFPVIVSIRGALGIFAIALSFVVPLVHRSRWKPFAILWPVVLAWLLFLSRSPWDPRKPFCRAYNSIQPGMTQKEVEAQFRREFAGRLPDRTFGSDSWYFCLDPNDGRYNAELIQIKFNKGRVTSAHYLPD